MPFKMIMYSPKRIQPCALPLETFALHNMGINGYMVVQKEGSNIADHMAASENRTRKAHQ